MAVVRRRQQKYFWLRGRCGGCVLDITVVCGSVRVRGSGASKIMLVWLLPELQLSASIGGLALNVLQPEFPNRFGLNKTNIDQHKAGSGTRLTSSGEP